MTGEDIAKYGGRLHSRFPWRRRRACRKLAADSSASAVPYLVTALHTDDPEVSSIAQAALQALKDARAVDALCAQWAQGRDLQLGRIVAERGYVARQPIEVRVLSALQANQLEMAGENAAAVAWLVQALPDQEAVISTRAEAALQGIKDAQAVDALCELAIAEPTGAMAAIVKEMDYQPQSVGRRCVLFLLTGHLELYLDLDFEFEYLRAEYQAGDDGLRQRIGDVVRQSGDVRLIGLFRASRQRKLASELTEREASIVIEVHARNQQWPEIFALLFHIPLSCVVAGLNALSRSDWRPQQEVEASLLHELFAVRSAVGGIPERPPAPDVVLGPVVARWFERGRGSEFRGQPPETLRKSLHQAGPPEAVAALATLIANGQDTADDIETARTHQHWLVRLACVALREIAPQFAFADTPIGGDGGGMWIERLGPAILDAAIYRRRPLTLNVDQLAALQAALNRQNPHRDGRWAWGRILETIARHHLRDTIEVDEQMTVEIEDTAIEIEG